MHVYFSGIGGTAIGPLALIAKAAGYKVSGSDAKAGQYFKYLQEHGLKDIHVGQGRDDIAKTHQENPIDWFIYSSAIPKDHEELEYCRENNIHTSKRDEFISKLIKDKDLALVAISGTQGKTTTTAMAIWVFKQLGIPVSYSVGAKVNFGEMGEFDPKSKYFVYEADEYDRNFLAFHPEFSLISGLDWDHPDIYPTREEYNEAFKQFLRQSQQSWLWRDDAEKLDLNPSDQLKIINQDDPQIDKQLTLAGHVNRLDAWLVAKSLQAITDEPIEKLIDILNRFPGSSRRFEQIAPNLYSDYAHTPPKIRGALQLAKEVAGDNVVVVYEGIHNLRQHFIKDELANLFDKVKRLYFLPTYLGREDESLKVLTPVELLNMLSNSTKTHSETAELDSNLSNAIKSHLKAGDLVIAFSASGAGGLDEWLRNEFA